MRRPHHHTFHHRLPANQNLLAALQGGQHPGMRGDAEKVT
jgi:hypothetical protein